jgi:phosphoglycolate phosphatase-like HAD superfamily hydrolase
MNEYRKVMDNAWIKESSISKFKELDLECAIFDCDGTLVNINDSYNACIKHTAGFILERMTGGKQWYDLVTDEIILKFRMSGGFNNDNDTTYVSVLAALAAKTDDPELARKFILNIVTHADENGIVSIERYLSDVGFSDLVKKSKDMLQYPAPVGASLLGRAFDEFFYGKKLFVKMHGMEPMFNNSNGFIDGDKVVISSESAKEFSKIFNRKIAIVSGRSMLATEYTLKPILHYFNKDACVFIEDEENEVMRNNLNLQVKKPFPYALLKSMKALNSKSALCVGDSVEDMLMARKASENGYVQTLFCGVYGAVPDPDLQFKVFMERKADTIIENVNLLPTLLKSVMK